MNDDLRQFFEDIRLLANILFVGVLVYFGVIVLGGTLLVLLRG